MTSADDAASTADYWRKMLGRARRYGEAVEAARKADREALCEAAQRYVAAVERLRSTGLVDGLVEAERELLEAACTRTDSVLAADECPVTDDGRHCSCWYDDNLPCCVCGLTNGGSE